MELFFFFISMHVANKTCQGEFSVGLIKYWGNAVKNLQFHQVKKRKIEYGLEVIEPDFLISSLAKWLFGAKIRLIYDIIYLHQTAAAIFKTIKRKGCLIKTRRIDKFPESILILKIPIERNRRESANYCR